MYFWHLFFRYVYFYYFSYRSKKNKKNLDIKINCKTKLILFCRILKHKTKYIFRFLKNKQIYILLTSKTKLIFRLLKKKNSIPLTIKQIAKTKNNFNFFVLWKTKKTFLVSGYHTTICVNSIQYHFSINSDFLLKKN